MVSREKFVADITARQEKRKQEERRKQERTRFDVNGYFHESVTRTIRKNLTGNKEVNMWGAFFSWGIPMFFIGCMAGYAFAPRKRR